MRSFIPLVKSSFKKTFMSRVYDVMIIGVWLFAVCLYVGCGKLGWICDLFLDGVGGV